MAKMDDLIKRINELAHKNKTIGLSEDEIKERAELRKEYIKEFRKGMKQNILDNIYFVDDKGNEVKAEPIKQVKE